MSVHYEEPGKRWIIRFRDGDGKQRSITANALNFVKYELPVPERITSRTVRRLETEVLRRETAADGSIRSADRRKMMYLDVVARYIPPLLSTEGKDVWEERPLGQNLENERIYSVLRVQHMILVLTRYFPAYLDTGKIRWRRNGRRKHDRVAKVYTCTRRIDSITCENVAGFQIYLTNSGLASATVRGYVTTLRTFFSWCTERGYMMTNPAGGIKLPSRKKREVKWLEKKSVRELLKATKGHPLEGPVRAILGLGLRRTEMACLEWPDLNFDIGIVRVRGTKTANAYREVPLPVRLADYFKSLPRSHSSPSLLLNSNGEPWNKDSLNSSLRRFHTAKKTRFHWNFQMLRASYGSLLVQEGVPIAHVSAALGHADVRVTQGWYIGLRATHISPLISKAIGAVLTGG